MKMIVFPTALALLGIALHPARAVIFDIPTGDTQDVSTPITEGIAKIGGGTLILSGTEDNAGAFANVEGGTLLLAKESSPSVHALGGGLHQLFAGATLRLGGTGDDQIFDAADVLIYSGGVFDLNGRSERIANYGGGGQIISSTGTGTLMFGEAGVVAINARLSDGGGVLNAAKVGSGLVSWLAANTHSGLTTVAEGTLGLAGNNVASAASTVNVASGATLAAQDFTNTLGGLEGSGAVLIGIPNSIYAGSLSVGANHADTTFNGVLLPSVGSTFAKVGNGTLTLGGAGDNVSFGATVSSGTLVLAKDSSASVHALGGDSTVAAGATLRLAGTGGDQIFDAVPLVVHGTFDVNDRAETLATVSGSGDILLGATGALTAGNSSDATLSGAVTTTAAGTFIKTGTGTLTLSGTADNTLLGVTVNDGTLVLAKASSASVHALGGASTVASGKTLRLAGTGGDQIADTAALTLHGTLQMNGRAEALGPLTGNGSVALEGGALTLGSGNVSATFGGGISGSGSLTKIGTGSLTLTGTSDITGNVTISAGTLGVTGPSSNLGNFAALHIEAGATFAANRDGSFDPIAIGSLSGSGTLTRDPLLSVLALNAGFDNTSTTFSGNITAPNLALIKRGTGTLTLSGSNSLASLVATGGQIVLASDAAFTPGAGLGASGGGTIDSGGRSLTTRGFFLSQGTLALGGGSLTLNDDEPTISTIDTDSAITGGGGFSKTGDGTLELNGTLDTSGPVLLQGGTTTVFFGGFSDLAAVSVTSPATLAYSFASDTVGSLAGNGTVTLEESTLTVGGNGASSTFSGNISGSNGSLVKTGSGSFTLSGTATHTGTTTVDDGTLRVTGSVGNVVVSPNGQLEGDGEIGELTMNGGTLAPGNSPGQLTVTDLNWFAGDLVFELGSSPLTSDSINVGNAFTGGAGSRLFTFENNGWLVNETYDLLTFASTDFAINQFGFTNGGGFDGIFSFESNTLQFTITAVPEPTASALLLAGLVAAAARRLRHT